MDPTYCEVFYGFECLDSGECGRDCGEGAFGGAAIGSGVTFSGSTVIAGTTVSAPCTACLPGYWSDRKRATQSSICVACPTGTYSTTAGCCGWAPNTYPSTPHPAATCVLCDVGTYANVAGSSSCKACPGVCMGGRFSGLYCRGDLQFTDLDKEQLGGGAFFINSLDCTQTGGECKALTTALQGATSAGQCELNWVNIPLAGNVRLQPYARFDNTLYTNELPDTPRSRLATGGDSYSSANTPTSFDPKDSSEIV